MDKSNEIEKEFSKWADDYGKVRYSFWEGDLSKQHLKAQYESIRMLKPSKGKNVLDIGCGVGYACIRLAEIIKPGVAYGIDITKAMIEKSRKNAKKHSIINVSFINCSVSNLPFQDNYFDSAISTHASHHFHRPNKMFSEIQRVLKPNAKFILIDTCGSSKLIQDFEKKLKKEEKAHHRFFKLSEIKRLLREIGFKNIKGYRKEHIMYLTAHRQ